MITSVVSVLVFLCVPLRPPEAEAGGRIDGRVIDVNGAGIPAIIRVIQPESGAVVLRFRARQNGMFQTETLPRGTYSITAYIQGWRRRELSHVIVNLERSTSVGDIQLDISDCDEPGVICDSVVKEKPPVAAGAVIVRLNCTIDLDRRNEASCPKADSAAPHTSRSADLRLLAESGRLYLVAVNGAAVSLPNASRGDCTTATYDNDRIAVAGLGPGVDLCVRTTSRFFSHLYFVDDVQNQSASVTLHYVTRKRH